jgi:hypothetical protein
VVRDEALIASTRAGAQTSTGRLTITVSFGTTASEIVTRRGRKVLN